MPSGLIVNRISFVMTCAHPDGHKRVRASITLTMGGTPGLSEYVRTPAGPLEVVRVEFVLPTRRVTLTEAARLHSGVFAYVQLDAVEFGAKEVSAFARAIRECADDDWVIEDLPPTR